MGPQNVLLLTMHGLLMQTSTDYGPYLANEPTPLHTTTIVDRCTEKLVDDWNKMRTNVSPGLPYKSAPSLSTTPRRYTTTALLLALLLLFYM